MYFIKLLRLTFGEAVGLFFVLYGVVPSILFRSWGAALVYYVIAVFVGAWLEVVARRAVKQQML